MPNEIHSPPFVPYRYHLVLCVNSWLPGPFIHFNSGLLRQSVASDQKSAKRSKERSVEMLVTELVSCALLVMTAVATAAASAFYSAPPARRNSTTATPSADDPDGIETAQVSLGNALAFPLVGSCTLIALFLTWKYVIVQYVLVLVRVLTPSAEEYGIRQDSLSFAAAHECCLNGVIGDVLASSSSKRS